MTVNYPDDNLAILKRLEKKEKDNSKTKFKETTEIKIEESIFAGRTLGSEKKTNDPIFVANNTKGVNKPIPDRKTSIQKLRERMKHLQKKAPESTDLNLETTFAAIAGDDGILTKAELEAHEDELKAMGKDGEALFKLLTKESYNELENAFDLMDKNASEGLSLEEFSILDQEKDGIIDTDEIDTAETMAKNGRLFGDVSDGEIGHFSQQQTGDCWFLTGLNELNQTEEGKAAIKEAITDNGNGTYTVNFRGADEEIIVTEEELNNNNNLGSGGSYANGDIDVRILEIAADKWRIENEGTSTDTGGTLQQAANLLLGYGESDYTDLDVETRDGEEWITGSYYDIDETMAYLENYDENEGDYYENALFLAPEGHDSNIVSGHAYSIQSVDNANGTITIINPWDTTNPMTMTIDNFIANGGRIELIEVENPDSETPDSFDNLSNIEKIMQKMLETLNMKKSEIQK